MSTERYIYGRHPVAELLRASPDQLRRIYVAKGGPTEKGAPKGGVDPSRDPIVEQAQNQGVQVEVVPRPHLERLVGRVAHQGVVAEVSAFAYCDIEDLIRIAAEAASGPPLLLALDQVQDPQNLGALIRSALALGAHGLLMPKDRSCEITPTVVKASAGATAHLPIAQVTNLRRALDSLKESGYWTVGTVANLKGSTSVMGFDFNKPTVIVIGSEGEGIRRLVLEACDFQIHIPMAGKLGSLNASVAGAICLFEAARSRTGTRP